MTSKYLDFEKIKKYYDVSSHFHFAIIYRQVIASKVHYLVNQTNMKLPKCSLILSLTHLLAPGQAQPGEEMVKMCLFYPSPSGHARSDPIINQQCASDHVHTVSTYVINFWITY